MERKFYHTDDFEELIKEKADLYKMYPSDRVWKGINKALHSRRRWYWSGFVLLLSGITYLAITELVTPSPSPQAKKPATEAQKPQAAAQLHPFVSPLMQESLITSDNDEELTSDFTIGDDGQMIAAFEIPLKILPGTADINHNQKASLLISGLEPLHSFEQYNIELSWPVHDASIKVPADALKEGYKGKVLPQVEEQTPEQEKMRINWLTDNAAYKYSGGKRNRISWQLAFAPTVNYRKLTGTRSKFLSNTRTIPLAVNIDGDIDNLVNHKPALGFELGTHGLLKLNNRFTFKAGLQFNYSKYDIRAFRAPGEMTTIALNSQTGINPIVGYSDLRNFAGTAPEEIKNQYFQLSVPVGFEYKVFGEDRLQFKVASTIQPTYLLNSNTYLITADFKNYAKEPSLVRKWNVNAGAEAYITYDRGGVTWQVGPQFRYQLLSSYKKEYPIKEYLMEYGIKVGITKTIR
ncbi:MAG: outer membrane beta-barrel protein [Chitinophagaceae bacterium]|nr:outer membrane beta-barrel protein [Chitinophagaceae bacterium]